MPNCENESPITTALLNEISNLKASEEISRNRIIELQVQKMDCEKEISGLKLELENCQVVIAKMKAERDDYQKRYYESESKFDKEHYRKQNLEVIISKLKAKFGETEVAKIELQFYKSSYEEMLDELNE